MMDLEELQKAWNELNRRVEQSECVQRQQLVRLLSEKKKTLLQRRIRAEELLLIFYGVFLLFVVVQMNRVSWVGWQIAVVASVLVILMGCGLYALFLLRKMLVETNLERQAIYALKYKRTIYGAYCFGYMAIIVFTVYAMTCLLTFYQALSVGCFLIGGVLIDCFLFRWQIGGLQELVRINRELKEISQSME